MAQELWDAYDREGTLGFDMVRGELPRNGVFHLVVEIYSITHDGRVLVTQRHPDKAWGECWEVTGGSVVKGETVDWWLVPYEKFPEFILKDCFVNGVRERFPSYRERFDRLIREHMNEK